MHFVSPYGMYRFRSGGVLIVSSIKSPYYVWFILYSCCLICLRTETINTPVIIHGYIDRMNPTVILLEERQEQLILANDEMPYESQEGMWVDVAIHKDYYEVLAVNINKTSQEQMKVRQLQKQLRKHPQ